MQILLTNDDGVFAPGLRALRKELLRLGDVTVVAPAMEQSGVGHSITLLDAPGRQAGRGRRRHDPGLEGRGEPGRQRQAGDLRADAAPSGPDRLGDQLGLERRDQRALLGHRGRGDRGGVLQDHQHRGLAGALRALRLPARGPARGAGDREDPGQPARQRLAVQRQPAGPLAGRAPGHPRRPHGHWAATARASSAGRTPAGGPTTG